MPPAAQWCFGPFRLDATAGCLWRDGQLLPLPPKPFAVLVYLVAHAGQVVSKQALLDAVWPATAVTEGVLKTCMAELRRALGETAQAPQYIATIHRRGYRFMASVTRGELSLAESQASSLLPVPTGMGIHRAPASPTSPVLLVAREAELAQLHQYWSQACQGHRQVIFVTGEAGIGKTTLVDVFVAQLTAAAALWVGHGQCIEQYGAGEAYLPLLEALSRLGQSPDGARLIHLLRQHAPSWLLQLPALVPDAEIDTLYRRASGAMPERMLRELVEAMEALTAEQPLVLVLEDLHWSDVSTLNWLTYVARRRTVARLLILGTYRPVEAMVHAHPVHTTVQDLLLHRQCTELALRYLPAAGVATYLAQRFGGMLQQADLAQFLHQRTSGNPLFLVIVVDDLVQQGLLHQDAEGWKLVVGVAAVKDQVPDSLRQLMEQQLAQLPPEEQGILEAASVAGAIFAAAAVAAAIGRQAEDVEARCVAMARRRQFLQTQGMAAWPDGTITARYEFLHALYHQVLYERVPAGQRAQWHRQVGKRLEAGYGEQARTIAVELAVHFEQGRDHPRAVQYLQYAGEQAMQRSAYQEAIGHLTTGLELLSMLPDTPERTRQELGLRLALAPALAVTRGYAAPEVEQAYVQAQTLCQQQGERSQSLLVVQGLWAVYNERLRFRQARDLGKQYLALAQQEDDSVALVEAHYALGTSLFYLGEFPTARWHFEQGITCYTRQRERVWNARTGLDPGVTCLALLASTLGFLGYPEQARQQAEEAQHLAQELAHPYSLAFARYRAGLNAFFCRETQAALELAEAVLSVATTHGFPFYEALGTALKGGALVRQGQGEVGLTLLRQGLTALYHTGTQPAPHWLVWQAELYGYVGQPGEGLRLLEEALVQADTTGNFHAVAELYRLKGEIFLALSAERVSEAEACFQQALTVARRQQAKALELRAAMSLSRLWQHQGKRTAARHQLAEVYGWFSEGFATADLQEARVLLTALA